MRTIQAWALLAIAGACLPLLSGCGDESPSNAKVTIEDLKEGTGPAAKAGDRVQVHYTGWLKNGKQFDSSVEREEPFVFPLGGGQVIKGWDEGIVGMKVGGKRKLIIPSQLAYGPKGRSPSIPPNSELTFEIELLKILNTETKKAKKDGKMVTTGTGLKYEDVKEGTGAEAKPGDLVRVHYTGRLKNGMKFDSSRDRDQPFEFTIGQRNVIPGWEEGVVGMKVGGQRKLIIPPELAYGAKGRPPIIPPNSELTFDIELLKVYDQ